MAAFLNASCFVRLLIIDVFSQCKNDYGTACFWYYLQMMTNAVVVQLNVNCTVTVSILLDLTYASVDKDSLEMDHTVLVSPA